MLGNNMFLLFPPQAFVLFFLSSTVQLLENSDHSYFFLFITPYFVMVCSILDNSQIQCLHGKVPISKVTSIKRLSMKAWDKLSSKVYASIVPYRILLIGISLLGLRISSLCDYLYLNCSRSFYL